MPPDGTPLTAAEVGRLRAWIEQGASWPQQTGRPRSFPAKLRPLVVSADPAARGPGASQPELGAQRHRPLRAGPAGEGDIAPSRGAADRVTLIRRLSLDLLGLPPTPDEVDAFLSDTRPDAYERLVDRLLASPHYGERWGRHWLDLARYADSDGYEKDTRPAVRLALPPLGHRRAQPRPAVRPVHHRATGRRPAARDATLEQKIATGFHRNTLTNKRGRRRSGAVPRRGRGRSRQHDGQGLARPDARLLPVPRPQVRSACRSASTTSSSPSSTATWRSTCRPRCPARMEPYRLRARPPSQEDCRSCRQAGDDVPGADCRPHRPKWEKRPEAAGR